MKTARIRVPNKITVLRITVFALAGVLVVPSGRAQVGSGAPQASAHVQVQSKVDDTTETPRAYMGQALDQDVAVLSKVPADPLFHSDPFHFALQPADVAMNDLRKSAGLSFAATYTVLNQYATATPEGVRHNWATGRFDLAGGWKAYDHGGMPARSVCLFDQERISV
jgi:porin